MTHSRAPRASATPRRRVEGIYYHHSLWEASARASRGRRVSQVILPRSQVPCQPVLCAQRGQIGRRWQYGWARELESECSPWGRVHSAFRRPGLAWTACPQKFRALSFRLPLANRRPKL